MTIAGHRTSISLEPEFWDALQEIAAAERLSVNELVRRIDEEAAGRPLSAAVRVHVLSHFRAKGTPD